MRCRPTAAIARTSSRKSRASRLVHQLAPGTFTYEVVTEPGNFAAFAHATDIMGADPYPCLDGHPCDWAQIPAYIAALNAAHVPRYWAVLQAFSYGQWRSPTAAELARMIGQWAAIAAGRASRRSRGATSAGRSRATRTCSRC